jgi:FG-GAP-like repeat/ASPIC and UnbV
MRKILLNFLVLIGILSATTYSNTAKATGEASTYFGIFVPPNNDLARRDVCLIVTAIYDNTYFSILDDDMDGDSDDSVTGNLMAGQSYILYIRENGVNDDAPHPGEGSSKQDGDYFIVTSDKLVLTSQSTNSDWQHDWVPATNKTSKGQRFIIYAPPTSFSNRDLNAYAYEDSTEITIRKISWANQTGSGLTNVDMTLNNIEAQRTLNIGEDIIFTYHDGRDIMEPGATYVVEANKDITVQYGALWSNSRDGGGYVPSSNGSSSGELFYFTVHYQANREQEIRIVSWDDSNNIDLEYYANGSWLSVSSWSLDNLESGDWVSYTGNIDKVFRLTCSPGKKVSVFEANWLETGSPGTSDVASMMSSASGQSASTSFLAYMAPPGKEVNVTDPFTGEKFSYGSHLYIFARDTAHVTVKDAYTNGGTIDRTYTILPERYIDCYLDLDEWKSIYNGDGNPNSGAERPYLLIQSDSEISIFNTNFNDNWMAYLGTAQTQDFSVEDSTATSTSMPGDTVRLISLISIEDQTVLSTEINVFVGDGASAMTSTFFDVTNDNSIAGEITFNSNTNQSEISFQNAPDLISINEYKVETDILMNVNYQNGDPIPDRTVISVETTVSGTVNGTYQQAATSTGILNETSNQSMLIFTKLEDGSNIISGSKNNWGISFADFNNDGYDDIFVPNYNAEQKSDLFKNNGDGTFTTFNSGPIANDKNGSVTGTWADYNNDGNIDLFVSNNPDSYNLLYKNNGNGSFSKILNDDIVNDRAYSHGALWGDFNNDGFVDMFVSDYMPTRFNSLYFNNGDGSFSKSTIGHPVIEATYSIGSSAADYDNDGDLDLFVTNDRGVNNSLYRNNGDGSFTKIINAVPTSNGGNSTGSSWADFDNDGDQDLLVTNASKQNNSLYINMGDGTFVKETDGHIVNDGGNSHGSVWGDMDNDGDLDLFISNDQNGEKFLYINLGDGTFAKNTNEIVTSGSGNSFGAALSDIDRDGDLDLYVANHSNEVNFMFLNNGNDNNWLQIKLQGTNSNASAIGAKIKIKSNLAGQSIWQSREISSQSGGGAGAQSSLVAHFGLANTAIVDSVIVEWPSGYTQYQTNISANQLLTIVEDNGSLVEGLVFNDINGDCLKDEGEQILSNVIIEVLPGPKYTSTNTDGLYSIYLSPGTYTLNQQSPDNWEQTCPASGGNHSVQVIDIGQGYSGYDFANQGIVSQPDLWVDIGATALRRGFRNTISISYKNMGTIPASNATLSANFDEEVIPVASNLAWTSANGNTYTWDLGNIPVNGQGTILIEDSVGVYVTLGQIVQINAEILATETDINLQNNLTTFNDSIVGSVDPNDILVSPEGYIAKESFLLYKIRFQNVGNYYASRVVVIDTLPPYLDISSIEFGAMSHQGQAFVNDKIIRWEFDNIYLPDSTNDEPNSHGFVKFSIKVKPSGFEGSSIRNRASIQFDYNDFIITNTVSNKISHNYAFEDVFEPTLVVHPNPLSPNSKARITNPLPNRDPVFIDEIRILNINGQVIESKKGLNSFEIHLGNINLKQGVYLLQAKTASGKWVSCKLQKFY